MLLERGQQGPAPDPSIMIFHPRGLITESLDGVGWRASASNPVDPRGADARIAKLVAVLYGELSACARIRTDAGGTIFSKDNPRGHALQADAMGAPRAVCRQPSAGCKVRKTATERSQRGVNRSPEFGMTQDSGMKGNRVGGARWQRQSDGVPFTGAIGWALPMPAARCQADQLSLVLFEVAVGARQLSDGLQPFIIIIILMRLYRALRGYSCGSRGFLEDRMMDIITGRAPPPARACFWVYETDSSEHGLGGRSDRTVVWRDGGAV